MNITKIWDYTDYTNDVAKVHNMKISTCLDENRTTDNGKCVSLQKYLVPILLPFCDMNNSSPH